METETSYTHPHKETSRIRSWKEKDAREDASNDREHRTSYAQHAKRETIERGEQ
jgi:hypothetical protein